MATERKKVSAKKTDLKELLKKREKLFIKLSDITQKIYLLEQNNKKSNRKKTYKDETEYLLSNSANREILLKSIAEAKKGNFTERELIEE